MLPTYYIKAVWDPEADVWCSETNVPGLVVECATLAEFEDVATSLASELLAENEDLHGVSVPFSFSAESVRQLKVA